jgi:hypothetical protein
MKRFLTLLAICGLFLSACDFAFYDQPQNLTEEAGLHCVETQLANGAGVRMSWYNSANVLQYYEDHYIQGGLTVQVQRFTAANALSYVYGYKYDSSGRKTLIAYFDATKTLQWYQAFSWTIAGNLETQREYNAANVLQWARKYSYVADVAEGKITLAARFNGTRVLDSLTVNEYDQDGNLAKASYFGEDACSRALSPSFSGSSRPSARALLSLTLPTVPAMPTLTMPAAPADPASFSPAVTGYSFWFYDASGVSSVSFDENWIPQTLSRDDTRLIEDINVSLSYDSLGRISRKVTQYGQETALDLTVQYEGNTLFPVGVTTTGKSLLLPLSYTLEYDANHYPVKLSVLSGGNLMHYFTYAYSGPTVPVTLEQAKSVDPFRLMDQLMSANLVIKHYDGDNALVETFTATAETNAMRVTVRRPDGTANGSYLLSYDGTSLASCASYSAAGAQLWSYSYDYAPDISALQGQKDRILEFLPGNAQQIAEAFLYDLLM